MIIRGISNMITKYTKQLTFGDGVIIAGICFAIYHYWYIISSYYDMAMSISGL